MLTIFIFNNPIRFRLNIYFKIIKEFKEYIYLQYFYLFVYNYVMLFLNKILLNDIHVKTK